MVYGVKSFVDQFLIRGRFENHRMKKTSEHNNTLEIILRFRKPNKRIYQQKTRPLLSLVSKEMGNWKEYSC